MSRLNNYLFPKMGENLDPTGPIKFADRKLVMLLGKVGQKQSKELLDDTFTTRHTLSAQTCTHTHPSDIKSTNYNKKLSFSELQYQSKHHAELTEETHPGQSGTKTEKAKLMPFSMSSFLGLILIRNHLTYIFVSEDKNAFVKNTTNVEQTQKAPYNPCQINN